MTTFIFELQHGTFYKAVEYRSKKRTLKNIHAELQAWAEDTCRHFRLEYNDINLSAYTYEAGEHLLALNK